MKQIEMNDILNSIEKNIEDKVTILSTDQDDRFAEAKEILLNKTSKINFELVDEAFIENFEAFDEIFNLYKEIRGEKEDEESLRKNIKNPNVFANLLVKSGYAAGIVSGATHPTADILRPAFQIIKTKVKDRPASSFMWMKKDGERDLFFADISVFPQPNAEQLAGIAMDTADSVKKIFGIDPLVAMLSFSTLGSGGNSDDVLKVREATEIAKENSEHEFIGEIQFDAAFNKKVFEQKTKIENPKNLPNVFIFPDLDSGNIGYKIAAQLGGYEAIGPILQNIGSPVNDLSRGCTSNEIANLVLITTMQSINK